MYIGWHKIAIPRSSSSDYIQRLPNFMQRSSRSRHSIARFNRVPFIYSQKRNRLTKMSQDSVGVVLDTGSSITKAGFAHEAFPRALFPTIVARFRRQGLLDGFPSVYCGKEAVQKRGLSKMTWPVQKGLMTDWDEMEKLWHHTFYKELHVAPEEARVMHAVHPLVTDTDKEKIAEIMFESFTVKGLYLMKSPVLALHASGRTTGVVWEAGFSCSYVEPIFEGFPLKHATILSPMTGELLTDRFQNLLAANGYSFTTPVERDLLNEMKENYCYVLQDYEAELNSLASSGDNRICHKLPDGHQIYLGDERVQSPEVLFKPALEALDCPSVPNLISSCISKCDVDYRSLFYGNIVLSGGSSMFPGLVDRLKAELTQQCRNQPFKPHVDAMPSRHYAAWIGGSIMASLDILKDFWLTKEEYEDGGAGRVRYKFF